MRRQVHIWLGVLVAATLVLSTLLAGCGAAASRPEAAPASAPNSAPGGAPQEGIKVHGHWTIEVTNPDGTLAERREFDNAIANVGSKSICSILGRQYSVGGWKVDLSFAAFGEPPFVDANGNPFGTGVIVESTDNSTQPYVFKTLTVDVPASGDNQDKVVLRGTATAQRNGSIGYVSTFITRLSATQPPSSSYTGVDVYAVGITHTNLASAVSLTTGQQVAVTVVISFS